MRHFDCAIIGSGPAGQHGAIQAAKLGKQACIIERCNVVGGAMVNTGTIPSKALREAVLYLTGDNRRLSFGDTFHVKRDINISELIYFSHEVVHHELQVIQEQFDQNNVQMVWGEASFIDANTLRVKDHD